MTEHGNKYEGYEAQEDGSQKTDCDVCVADEGLDATKRPAVVANRA
jgi:hypothetical protein